MAKKSGSWGHIAILTVLAVAFIWFHYTIKDELISHAKDSTDYIATQVLADRKWAAFRKKDGSLNLLPAQVTRETTSIASESGKFNVRLIASHPINPKNSAQDSFERSALEEIDRGEDSFEEIEGMADQKVFRKVIADKASAESCVDPTCHPGKKIGDSLGGLSISVPLWKAGKDAEFNFIFLTLFWFAIAAMLSGTNRMAVAKGKGPAATAVVGKRTGKESLARKVLLPTVITLIAGFGILLLINLKTGKENLLDEENRKSDLMAATIIKSLQSMMLNGHAIEAKEWYEDLKSIDEARYIQILRLNGDEAFMDDETIVRVNHRMEADVFDPRGEVTPHERVEFDKAKFIEAIRAQATVKYVETIKGERLLTQFTPIKRLEDCVSCHGSEHKLRAILRISTPLAEMEEKISATRWNAIFISLLINLGTFLLIGWLVKKRATEPITFVGNTLKEIATGDLTQKIELQSRDEIGDLADNVNNMVNDMNQALAQVVSTSDHVSDSITDLAGSAGHILDGARDQNVNISHVAATMEEMSATVTGVAQSSSDVAGAAKNAAEMASNGGEIVRKTIEGMEKIAHTVENSSNIMRGLGKSSEKVGDIVKVIDDIADQTNLLALNAAIEAARAGEQGRGFAVVADEVRKLAERTTTATQEIAEMIGEIQKETVNAVNAMEEGTGQVHEGTGLAKEAGKSLEEIVAEVNKVSNMITQIAASVEQQSAATEEITGNVAAISKVSEDVERKAQESVGVCDQVKALADELKIVITKFKLK